jgi:cholesterol transport system auxiliary component
MPSRRQMIVWPFLLLPASCALLKTTPPDRIFALTPLAPAPLQPTKYPQIIVSEPAALRVLDTERIANRANDLEFQYYSGAIWEDRAPTVFQHLLMASLRNRLKAQVSADQMGGTGTSLTSDLQDFQIEPGNQIHVTLIASFNGQTRNFEVRQTAASDRMADLVAAFNQACHAILEDLVGWLKQ